VSANVSDSRANRGVVLSKTREEIIGQPSHHQVSDLGVVQFRNSYDEQLLRTIAEKAKEIKDERSDKRHLDLKYIRGAHRFIPEISELFRSESRIEWLSELAGTRLEPYPISVISTIITFMDAHEDGSIMWHADGIPVTELVPLEMPDLEGGELELYTGNSEVGLVRQERGEEIENSEILRVQHRTGHSILGQLMRLMHRVRPIISGYRITLNMNLRSYDKPYVDDNSMCYLGADNPDFQWEREYVTDVKGRQLPAYLANT